MDLAGGPDGHPLGCGRRRRYRPPGAPTTPRRRALEAEQASLTLGVALSKIARMGGLAHGYGPRKAGSLSALPKAFTAGLGRARCPCDNAILAFAAASPRRLRYLSTPRQRFTHYSSLVNVKTFGLWSCVVSLRENERSRPSAVSG